MHRVVLGLNLNQGRSSSASRNLTKRAPFRPPEGGEFQLSGAATEKALLVSRSDSIFSRGSLADLHWGWGGNCNVKETVCLPCFLKKRFYNSYFAERKLDRNLRTSLKASFKSLVCLEILTKVVPLKRLSIITRS